MKKTIILILAVLPIFLLITIAFAGRILALYQFIPVERVEFVDRLGTAYNYEEGDLLRIDLGDTDKITQPLYVKIYPELATEKAVTFTSSDEEVCTVDAEGKITAKKVGYADVTVFTKNSNKTSTLKVRITDDDVRGITLEPTEMDLVIGNRFDFTHKVLSPDALDQVVWYTSNDTSVVKVIDQTKGIVEAIAPGTITITATTNDGAFTATCIVHAIEGTPTLTLDFSTTDYFTEYGSIFLFSNKYVDETIDLTQFLVVDETLVNKADVKFDVPSGKDKLLSSAEDIANGKIQFDPTKKGIIRVSIYVGDPESPTYLKEIMIQKL